MPTQQKAAEQMSPDTIRRIHESAKQKLKERYPKLDEAWEAVEKEFAQYHFPQPVYLMCWEEMKNEETTTRISVTITRHTIWVSSSWTYTDPDFVKEWHITKAPVALRVRLVEYLPAMREAIVKSAEGFVPKVDEAIQTLNDFVTVV